LDTGEGIATVLAIAVSQAQGSTRYELTDDRRTLIIRWESLFGVKILNPRVASRITKIIIAGGACTVGGIWSPLLPNVTKIRFSCLSCDLKPHTFAGLQLTKVTIRMVDLYRWLRLSCLAFDSLPRRITFNAGESAEVKLAGRSPKDILQVAGFIPAECFSWPHQLHCDSFAFLGAHIKSFDFRVPLRKIGRGAFAATDLERLVIPDSVCEIEAMCFLGCHALRSVHLGEQLRILHKEVFSGCQSLAVLTFGFLLWTIGSDVFNGTRSLHTFDFGRLRPGWTIASSAFSKSGLCSLIVNSSIVFHGARSMFSDCDDLQEVEINCGKVNRGMFERCRRLRRVTLTGPVSRIGQRAFNGCTALQQFDLTCLCSNGRIKSSAFFQSGLIDIILPAKLKSIDSQAFAECQSLRSVQLPQKLGSLGARVFSNCPSLRTITAGQIASGATNLPSETVRFMESNHGNHVPELIALN
jgi:hypothetical protein